MKYYEELFPKAHRIIVSDYTPNEPFKTPEEYGWEEVSREYAAANELATIWYRRSTSMGKARTYIATKNAPDVDQRKIALEIDKTPGYDPLPDIDANEFYAKASNYDAFPSDFTDADYHNACQNWAAIYGCYPLAKDTEKFIEWIIEHDS